MPACQRTSRGTGPRATVTKTPRGGLSPALRLPSARSCHVSGSPEPELQRWARCLPERKNLTFTHKLGKMNIGLNLFSLTLTPVGRGPVPLRTGAEQWAFLNTSGDKTE